MKTSAKGIEFIKRHEALRLTSYRCEAGRLTVGWGCTGPDVVEGMVITRTEAERRLRAKLDGFERDVNFLLAGHPVAQNEFDALVSFAFNVGSDIDADKIPEGLGDSTLLAKLLRGDRAGTAEQFLVWNKVRDPKTKELRVSNGLTLRRRKERLLFLGLA